ncbi:MAG: hypothetical protein K8J09_22805 [Planctomycetes bacterium]|nr:hypothetical protein [Planctomycetota bacterium]MCC7398636.1 hypothetical protein [Planctomycetota bacterium]
MTETGESTAVGVGPTDKILIATVVEVTFKAPVKASLAGALVTAPHWKFGDPADQPTKKPVVYALNTASVQLEVKVEVTKSQNVSGDAKLIGTLDELTFEGQCPTGEGKHTVQVTLKKVPDSLRRLRGSIVWGLECDGAGLSLALNATQVEFFTIFKPPLAPFPAHGLGVPVEALRWVFLRGGVDRVQKPEELVVAVTRACHGRPGTKYDTVHGGAHFLQGGSVFELLRYCSPGGGAANCYDQAAAVYLLSRAFGADVRMLYLGYSQLTPDDNFGYINTTALVGVQACNNPFYQSNGSTTFSLPNGGTMVVGTFPKPLAPTNWNQDTPKKGMRTSFGNHAFCSYSDQVYDACAGPVTGTSRSDYVKSSIDASCNYYDLFGSKPGTAADIATNLCLLLGLQPTSWV